MFNPLSWPQPQSSSRRAVKPLSLGGNAKSTHLFGAQFFLEGFTPIVQPRESVNLVLVLLRHLRVRGLRLLFSGELRASDLRTPERARTGALIISRPWSSGGVLF